VRFLLVYLSFEDSLPIFLSFVHGFQACRLPWGTRPPRTRQYRWPTTPLNRSWRICRPPPLRSAKRLRRAWRRLGVRWRVACAPSGACLPVHALRPSPGRQEGPRRGVVPLSGGLRGRVLRLRHSGRRQRRGDESQMRSPPLLPKCLPRTSPTSCSQMFPAPATLKPEDHCASSRFLFKCQCWGHVAM
jgi:hypothetical protein